MGAFNESGIYGVDCKGESSRPRKIALDKFSREPLFEIHFRKDFRAAKRPVTSSQLLFE